MKTLKKALSVILCAAMMFTTLCFFPIDGVTAEAQAAVSSQGAETALYVPEIIYLYPDVTSWTAPVKTPFQYYVNNTVDVNNIYNTPVAEANLDSTGKIYFASEEGMSDVSVETKFINLDGTYMDAADFGTAEYKAEDKGGYYLITVTDGVSPEMAADVNGCYIEWAVSYTTDLGERKTAFNYSYIYKPYVVPYGAAVRAYNAKGDINAYGQHITWVTGVHSVDTNPAQTHTIYPRYIPVSQAVVSADNTRGQYPFSPFLSRENKAYVGGVEVSGAAPVANGGYNAVFAGTDADTSYFWANQTGAEFSRSYRVREFFSPYSTDPGIYPVAFDYYYEDSLTSQYSTVQVTPTKIGSVKVDISRYNNLNEIPNLAVGMMITDVDFNDAANQNRAPISQWYIGDATGKTVYKTDTYTDFNEFNSIRDGIYIKFAYEKDLSTPLAKGIIYAGSWLKELDKTQTDATYTLKSYYESKDKDGDYLGASASINLKVEQVDKSELRAAVDRAVSYFGVLGVKENWNSYYYDVNYIDPDTGTSAWGRFREAYINACGALGNVDFDLPLSYNEYAEALNTSLDALLSGKGLRVYFDVNHDDIGVNLWINPSPSNFTWDANNEAAIINGTYSTDTQFGTTPFTPDAAAYTISATQLSGTYNKAGCVVFDMVDANNVNVTNAAAARYNFDFEATASKTVTYEEENYLNIEGVKFWRWYYNVEGDSVFDNFTVQLKIEKGNKKTAYSPAGKIVTGTTYGTLPVPTREGYTFAGWYTDEALTTAVGSDSEVSARILYAKWTANEYSVSYDNIFSVNEMASNKDSMRTNRPESAYVSCENGVITITADGAPNGDVYAPEGKGENNYNIPIEPFKEYVLEYDVDISEGGGSQVLLFFYDDTEGNLTWYPASDVTYSVYKPGAEPRTSSLTAPEHIDCYVHEDAHVVVRFTTTESARLLSVRFGVANSGNTATSFSNIRFIDAETYDKNINWTDAQKSVAFNADVYGALSEPTREGYVFDGWVTADGEEITADTKVKSENITVYSSWIPNQYSVALDGNTGIGGLGMFNAVYGTPFNLPANYFIKTGYTFAGWSLSPDGEVLYTDEEEVSNLTSEINGSITLYAIWTANKFTVKFNANTGSGEMADAVITYDSEAPLPENGFNKTGYTFIGWSTTPDGTELLTDVQYDNLCTEDGDTVTLYAIWSENSYTLTFDKNGGEGENIPATVYGYEDEVALPKNVFTMKGYILSGWSLTKNGEKVYENGATVNHINPDKNGKVTLYAVWEPVKYTVSFNSNGGNGTMADTEMTYDAYSSLADNTFTKTGYHFIGWSTAADGAVEYTDGQSVRNLAYENGKTVTLYAVWEINVYTVTFRYRNNKGVMVDTPVEVEYSKEAKIPSDFTLTPYKDATQHYVFGGWSADFSSVTSDLTVIARYYDYAVVSHNIATETKESTCTVKGFTRTYCTSCSHEIIEEAPLKDHAWNDGAVTTEPGCLTNGVKTYTCSVCGGTKGEAVSPAGHNLTVFAQKAPTCKETGNIEHKYCDRCKLYFGTDATVTTPESESIPASSVIIAKLPHTPGDEATCTTAQTCTVCGEILKTALGHTEKTEYITTDATCTSVGAYTVKVTCTVCGETVSEYATTGTIPHSYSETVIPPTCTDEGYTVFTCTVCGKTYEGDYVDALGHTEGEWRVTTAPDCDSTGIETNYCSVCGTGYKTRVADATGHDAGEWKVTIPAECENWGTESLLCTACGETITTRGIAPKGHGTTRTETTPAGCETAGREATICNDCGKELSFKVIPEAGHTPDRDNADCENDKVCTVCGTVLEEKTGHAWDLGTVTKEPTETEEGVLTYTCKNDPSHTKTEAIPVRVVITLPDIPADGTVDFDADENGYIGNIHNIISVEDGVGYDVTVADTSVITMDSVGHMTANKDGETEITVTTADGKFTKTFTVTVRTLKTVTFDIRGTITTVKAYAGEKVTAPEVASYTQGGFTFRFKSWTVDGVETDDLTVTGDITYVATYTSSCDYKNLDKLTEVFYSVIDGSYDNEDKIKIYKSEIEAAKAKIEEFSKDRDVRDISEQPAIDAAADMISGLISALYPEENGRIFIVSDDTVSLGSVTKINAYLSPLNTLIANGIWTSSDETIGFFVNGKFHAVRAGTVTVTVSAGNLSASKEITVTGGTNARVIMFDSLLTNANYIVEGSLIIKETTNIFWATDAPIHFRVITDGTFEEYRIFINNKEVTPDASGTYTIEANTGDAHVRIEGIAYEDDETGAKLSFWEMLVNFFRKIGEFFKNLFKF